MTASDECQAWVGFCDGRTERDPRFCTLVFAAVNRRVTFVDCNSGQAVQRGLGYFFCMLPSRSAHSRSNPILVRSALRQIRRHQEDAPLTLHVLAASLEVSPFRLIRASRQVLGLSIMDVARRIRLRRAAMKLAFRHGEPIAAIALQSGYDSHEAFTRAFKRVLGVSPSVFRSQPDWSVFHHALDLPVLHDANAVTRSPVGVHQLTKTWSGLVSVVNLPAQRTLALMHHPDSIGALEDTLKRFVSWRRQRGGLSPRTHATWNVLFAPVTASSQPSLAIAVATSARLRADDRAAGIAPLMIGGGRHARLRLEGPDTHIAAAVTFLMHTWCPAHAVIPGPTPLLLRRLRLFPDVPEHLVVTDIHLPIEEKVPHGV
jgi:AraC family transcriptional regulator